jgi:hypothetical protein
VGEHLLAPHGQCLLIISKQDAFAIRDSLFGRSSSAAVASICGR